MNIIRYFFPKRKLHRIPKHISAHYDRGDITQAQAILMYAGFARDPQEAQRVYNDLWRQHRSNIWKHVEFELRRKRTATFGEKLMRLLRFIFGEHEYSFDNRKRPDESIVYMEYEYNRDEQHDLTPIQ